LTSPLATLAGGTFSAMIDALDQGEIEAQDQSHLRWGCRVWPLPSSYTENFHRAPVLRAARVISYGIAKGSPRIRGHSPPAALSDRTGARKTGVHRLLP
jgi:hypothetical protein